MKPTPTFAPELFREAGVKEQFSGDALTAIEKAQRAFDRGMYPEALGDFLEAQRLHGRTSHVLPSKIGTTSLALGQHQAAIRVQGSGLGFLGGVCGATAYNASRLMRYLMS